MIFFVYFLILKNFFQKNLWKEEANCNLLRFQVKWTIYLSYIKAVGYFITCLFFSIYIFSSVLGVLANLWLADWSDHAKAKNITSVNNADDTNWRLGVYASLGMSQGINGKKLFIFLCFTFDLCYSSFQLSQYVLLQ